MPYKLKNLTIWHKKDGKWQVKQTATSPENARKTIVLLEGLDHGLIPRGSKEYRIRDAVIKNIKSNHSDLYTQLKKQWKADHIIAGSKRQANPNDLYETLHEHYKSVAEAKHKEFSNV